MNRKTYSIIPYYGYNYPINSRPLPYHHPIGSQSLGGQPIVSHYPWTLYALESPIEQHYQYLKRKRGFVGTPITAESPTSDGVGRFRHY